MPTTRIYVQSLLPDYRDFITALAHSVKLQVKQINDKKFTYIDLHGVFLTPQGTLNPKFTTDGAHLNREGYELWKQQLLPYMETL
ncbi:hypothetical protein GCM10009409_23700 [Shewanella saliphila]|uniref:SGNH hydrolase-type esterase domain-containing protein n=1 Tax=Shewanella saliphila TaxID=2282698 RepID=A0ABQ2Q975_9GAMM|nr:hypothetical protein GCM10009409_23700 [Shewanella saliphila]